MKKNVFQLLFVFLFVMPGFANFELEYGILGSANMTSFRGQFEDIKKISSVPNQSFGIGAVFYFKITKNIGLQLEPVYAKKGGQNGIPGLDNHKIEIRYLESPVLMRFTWRRWFINTGGYYSYLLNARHIYKIYDRKTQAIKTKSDQITHKIRLYDEGFIAGIGINLPVKETERYFSLEIQYHNGFTNVLLDTKNGNIKNRGFTLKLGILL